MKSFASDIKGFKLKIKNYLLAIFGHCLYKHRACRVQAAKDVAYTVSKYMTFQIVN